MFSRIYWLLVPLVGHMMYLIVAAFKRDPISSASILDSRR